MTDVIGMINILNVAYRWLVDHNLISLYNMVANGDKM